MGYVGGGIFFVLVELIDEIGSSVPRWHGAIAADKCERELDVVAHHGIVRVGLRFQNGLALNLAAREKNQRRVGDVRREFFFLQVLGRFNEGGHLIAAFVQVLQGQRAHLGRKLYRDGRFGGHGSRLDLFALFVGSQDAKLGGAVGHGTVDAHRVGAGIGGDAALRGSGLAGGRGGRAAPQEPDHAVARRYEQLGHSLIELHPGFLCSLWMTHCPQREPSQPA